jgi:hypothetical protein
MFENALKVAGAAAVGGAVGFFAIPIGLTVIGLSAAGPIAGGFFAGF